MDFLFGFAYVSSIISLIENIKEKVGTFFSNSNNIYFASAQMPYFHVNMNRCWRRPPSLSLLPNNLEGYNAGDGHLGKLHLPAGDEIK